MELIDDLDVDLWSSGDPNQTKEYKEYRLMKSEKSATPGDFLYAVFDNQGFSKKVLLHGASGSRDPLKGVSMVQLRLSSDETEVRGIIVEDDCVTWKADDVTAPGDDDVTNGSDVNSNVPDVISETNGISIEESFEEIQPKVTLVT